MDQPQVFQTADPGDAPLRRMALAAGFVLLGLLAATNFALWAQARGAGWPRDSFLFSPSERFSDLIDLCGQNRYLDPYFSGARGACYLPSDFWGITCLRGWSLRELILAYEAASLGAYLLVCALAAYAFRSSPLRTVGMALLLAVVVFASYPFLFTLDRGNLESIIGALCFLSLLLLFKDRPVSAALVLVIPIALKGYPLLLCPLFAARGRWRAALLAPVAPVAALLLNLSALRSMRGGLVRNWTGLRLGMASFHRYYIVGLLGMHYSADPYNAIRMLEIWWSGATPIYVHTAMMNYPYFAADRPAPVELIDNLMRLADCYPYFSWAVLAACVAYTLLARAPFHRRLLAATLGMLLWPDVANDYKLLHLLPVLFFMAVSGTPWSRTDRLAFGAILLLLVPKHYYFLFSDVSVSCLVSPLLLLLLLATLAPGWPTWRGARGLPGPLRTP